MAKRILAVDDSRTFREMLSITLKQGGHHVQEAQDGEEAQRILASATFDLVIADLNMPRLDGLGLVRAIRKSGAHRSVPVVILTTEGDPAKKADAKAAGATG